MHNYRAGASRPHPRERAGAWPKTAPRPMRGSSGGGESDRSKGWWLQHHSRLHLQRCGIGGGLDVRLVHGSGLRGADLEEAGIISLNQVNVNAPRTEIGVEECGTIVAKFLACKQFGPPIGLVVQRVEASLSQELSASRDGVLGLQVLPIGSVERQLDGNDVTNMDRAFQGNQVVGDWISWLILALLQQIIVARNVERELTLLEGFAVGGVPTVGGGPVGNAVAALADCDLAATPGLRRRNFNLPRRGEDIFGTKVAFAYACAIHENLDVGGVGELAAQGDVIGEPLDHHRGLFGRVPIVAFAMFGEP